MENVKTNPGIRKAKLLIFFSSLIIFICSLFNNGFYTDASNPTAWSNGLVLLLIGWMGDASWVANVWIPFVWILLFRKPLFAFLLGCITIAVSLSFLSVDSILTDEAGHHAKIVSIGMGYWLWLGSQLVATLGAIYLYMVSRKTAPAQTLQEE